MIVDHQAQSFEIFNRSFLTGFNFGLNDKNNQETSPMMEIRNGTPDGNLIFSFQPIFSHEDWNLHEFSPSLILNPGNFCVIMEEISGPQFQRWQKSLPGEDTAVLYNHGRAHHGH